MHMKINEPYLGSCPSIFVAYRQSHLQKSNQIKVIYKSMPV